MDEEIFEIDERDQQYSQNFPLHEACFYGNEASLKNLIKEKKECKQQRKENFHLFFYLFFWEK